MGLSQLSKEALRPAYLADSSVATAGFLTLSLMTDMPPSAPLFPKYLLWIWFALTALSVAYVAWDLFARTPEMKVMKWG